MWTVTEDGNEYAVNDHNGDEQARLSADNGISTTDVKEIMHDRAATLKSQLEGDNGNKPVPIEDIIEWMTIVEDMAGNNIELLPNGQ